MAKNKFLLLSLNETKSKKLAQVLSNNTSRKILDYLAEKEATESEIARHLNIPISTIHYNLQALKEGSLVESTEFHYSPKGKEVNHYKLANQYIIIAPKSTYGIKEKLKSILPVALAAAGIAVIMQYISSGYGSLSASLAEKALVTKALVTDEAAAAASLAAGDVASNAASSPSPALLFLAGSLFALTLYLLIDYLRKRKSDG
jgi:DNA-binding transcriptional ArsR family regulator